MSSEASEPKKKTKIVYSRDFLLSFGELKKLPAGFDTALLSELQEGYYHTTPGRPDGSGSYTYSSRGGNSGARWDTRSTGSSDRDGELPDRVLNLTQDRRNANQYRRSWQNTEHDGLLGSGGFPRPSGYDSQLASKDHGTAYQRTSQRYQPPRPYKKDIDSINDETFGSSDYSNEDRAEEERKRRASFELMRKEQHKAMQGKKNGPDILTESPTDDIISHLQTKNEKLYGSTVSSNYQESVAKTSSVLPPPAARPLVPPGFANAFVEKKLQSRSSNTSLEPKGHNATIETNMATIAQSGHQLEKNKSATYIAECESKEEKGISDNIANLGQEKSLLYSTEFFSGILKGTGDWESDLMDKYSIEKEGKSKTIDPVRKDSSVSILEQFFGNALSKGGSDLPTYVENMPLKIDDGMVPSVPESSKFTRWFHDEDLKPAEDLSSTSVLSMIVKNENPDQGNIVCGPLSDGVQNLSPRSPIGKLDSGSKMLSFTSRTAAGEILKQRNRSDIPETVPVMMTCEDLEQAMLQQVKSNGSSSQKNAIQEHPAVMDEPVATQKVAVDNHASHHLLSLLQKGTDSDGSSSLGLQLGSEGPQSVEVNLMANSRISGSDIVDKAENTPTSGKNLTLEALFGSAFMSELHSKDAPVSIRGSTTGGPSEFVETGKTLLPSGHEAFYPVEPPPHISSTKDGAFHKEPGIEYRNSALLGPDQGKASFETKGLEIQLPEEDNLFTMNETLRGQNSNILTSVRSSRVEGMLPEKAVDDLRFRLQSLVPGDAEQGQQGLGPDALSHEQHYQAESQNLCHLLQGRPPMMAHHPMMDHAVNRNQRTPFDGPQPTHHDLHRSYPANVNPMQRPLHGPGVPHLDPAAHHLMLQHISMPGSFPPEGLTRGVPPSQPVHHMPGYRPEMSNVNSFHMHPRQPSYGEFGLMPGPEVRSNHPGAFERLMQMEMSGRAKQQVQPALAGPVPGGMYGHELDMNLRYR